MASEDADITTLLSEPNLPGELVEASDDLSPIVLESIRFHEKLVDLPPEEAAWADSCLVRNSELSDDCWEEMREALLDALQNSVISPYDTPRDEHEERIQDCAEGKPVFLHVEEPPQHNDVQMEQSNNSDDDRDCTEVCEEARHVLIGAQEHSIHTDNATRDGDTNELGSSRVHDDTESRESIFKVWDLETSFSDEEDELIKELKKFLKSTNLESSLLPLYDPGEAMSQAKIDELVADMSDLSLQQFDD